MFVNVCDLENKLDVVLFYALVWGIGESLDPSGIRQRPIFK